MATAQLTSPLPSPSATRDPTPLNTQEQDEHRRHAPVATGDMTDHRVFANVCRRKSLNQSTLLRQTSSGLHHTDHRMLSNALIPPLVFNPPKSHSEAIYPLAHTETPLEFKRFTFPVEYGTAVFEEMEATSTLPALSHSLGTNPSKSLQGLSSVPSPRKRSSSWVSDIGSEDTRKSRQRTDSYLERPTGILIGGSSSSRISPLSSPLADDMLENQYNLVNSDGASLLDTIQGIPYSDTHPSQDERYHHHTVPLSYPVCRISRSELAPNTDPIPDLDVSTAPQATDFATALPTPVNEASHTAEGSPDSAFPSPSLSPLSIAHDEHNTEANWANVPLIPPSVVPCDTDPLPQLSTLLDTNMEQQTMDSSSLPSPASLVDSYSLLPSKIQSYIMFQLLKRTSLETLRDANMLIMNAFRTDILSRLPVEIGRSALKYLDVKSMCEATRVCKHWKQRIDGDAILWHDKFVEARFSLMSRDKKAFPFPNAADTDPDKAPCPCSPDPKDCYVPLFQQDQQSSPPSNTALANTNAYKEIYRQHHIMRCNWRHNRVRRIQLNGHPNNVVTCLQFDEEKIITGSDDQCVSIYDIKTGELIRVLEGHEGGVWALQYVGNLLVTGSTDRTIRIWDIEKGQCRHVFRGHDSTVRCLTIVMPTSTVGSKLPSNAAVEPAYPMLVSGSRDATLRVWALPDLTGDPMHTRNESMGDELDDAMTDDMQSNFSEDDGYHNGSYHIHTLIGHTKSVRTLAAYGNIVASGSYDHTVRLWDIESGTSIGVLSGHDQKVYSVVIDHKRGWCISGSMDSTVRIWDVNDMTCRYILGGHTILVGLLGLSDNYLVSAAADQTVRIWSPETGECKHILSGHQSAITSFQHDEHKIISGSEGGLKMWDIKTGRFMHDLIQNISGVWRVVFDERYCVAAVKSNEMTRLEILDYGFHGLEDMT